MSMMELFLETDGFKHRGELFEGFYGIKNRNNCNLQLF